MVKEITILKMRSFKNNDDKMGAMAEAIKQKNSNEIIVHTQTVKFGRAWCISTPEKFIDIIDKNYGFYEVITSYPHKVYFDIDKNDVPSSTFLVDIKKHILSYFPDAKMAISGSTTDIKTSYHIVLENYIIHNLEERIYVKNIVKYLNTVEDSFDWKVYTNNRNMKCINQSKDDGRIQTIIENQNIKDHLITCFLNIYPLPFPKLQYEINELINIEKSKLTFDLSKLPKLKLKCTKNIDLNELSPLEMLNLLPLDNSGKYNHDYTHLIARFCYYNDLSFEHFLSWIQQKHHTILEDSTILNKWNTHWKNIAKFPHASIDKIKNILYYFYPNIKKDIFYRKFNDSFTLDNDLIHTIPTISQLEFKSSNKYSIFNVGMGGGKTHQTIEYLSTNPSFCWIAPNKALASNTLTRLKEKNININHYLGDTTKMKKEGSLKTYDNMIIVANSLHYLFDKKYKIVVIDEIETLLDKWFGTFMQNKQENWNTFLNIIRNADKVILLDAFITSKTINFIKSIDEKADLMIYQRANEPITRTVNYIKDSNQMINNIITDLKNGLKLFIFYPYKKSLNEKIVSMIDLYNIIVEKTGKKGIFYNADIDEKVKMGLKDVNSSWSDQHFIITNSIITCGVNYEREDFDKEYLFIASFSIPRDVIQVSYRPRFLSSGIINVCFIGKNAFINSWEDDSDKIKCTIYTHLIESILIEKKSPLRKTFQLFCVKARYKQTTDLKKLDEMLQLEITNMLLDHQNGFSYKGIPDIDHIEAEILQNNLFSGEATMPDKFMLQKYHFKNKFTEPVDEKQLYKDALEEAWNNQYIFFFDQCIKMLNDANHVFNKICTLNKLEECIIGDKIEKMILNDEIIEQIFKEFKFKYIGKTSSKKLILKEIYNTYFGCRVVDSDHNKETKMVKFNIDLKKNDWFKFVKEHRKIYDKVEETHFTFNEQESTEEIVYLDFV